MDNIFMHDAVPTWSGFLYQGRIAVYLAVRKINELRETGNESAIKKYALEMEKCEDIAVVYMNGNNKKYHSIHQVKNEKGCKLESYKAPLIQLMLEKGFCRKNNYGTPAAYLHISKEINYENESMNGHALECLKNWKADILKFYNELSVIYDSFIGNEVTLKRLLDIMKNNTKTIGINPLEYSYRFIGLVKQVEVLEEKYQREQKAQLILKNIQKKQYEDLNWLFIQEEKLLEDDSIAIIKQQLGVISNLRKAQGILQNAMTALGQSRETLVKNANAAMEAGGISDKQCPLCGAPYSDRDELDSKIKEETELLSDISDDSVIIIQDIRNQIYNNYLKKVEKTIQEILANAVTEEMYQSLQDAKKYGPQILEVERILEKIGVGLNKKDNESIVEGYNNLLTKVKEALKYIPKEVEIQLESRKFIECYERFYSKEEQRFIAVDVEKLRNKKNYIETLNYNFYAAELSKKKGELEHIQKKIDKLHELVIELRGYQSALKEGIQEYKKKIISDIEPLLHIYTAKILQQKFNGKSIYIHTSEDVEDIQFVNSAQDNQDILYSMSSGQLSAVALSFLLCMNQAYGAHKACSILLIDDPVQTIDDVNMVGLVDILRYGFGDRQIFISTHEQSFEWFLRYRYSKAGKNVKIFNMKDIMLQEE